MQEFRGQSPLAMWHAMLSAHVQSRDIVMRNPCPCGERLSMGVPVHFFTSDVAWQIGHPPSLGISFAARGCMKRIRKGNMLNGCLCANPAFHSRTPADQPNMQRQQPLHWENFEHRRLRKPNLDCGCMGHPGQTLPPHIGPAPPFAKSHKQCQGQAA